MKVGALIFVTIVVVSFLIGFRDSLPDPFGAIGKSIVYTFYSVLDMLSR